MEPIDIDIDSLADYVNTLYGDYLKATGQMSDDSMLEGPRDVTIEMREQENRT